MGSMAWLACAVLTLFFLQGTGSAPEPSQRAVAGALDAIDAALAAGDREDARRILREAVSSLTAAPDGSLVSALAALDARGQVLGCLEQQALLRQAILAARSRELSGEHPDVLAAKGDLADIKRALKDYAGARVLYEEVLAVRGCSLRTTSMCSRPRRVSP
jgi:hypothetical protein